MRLGNVIKHFNISAPVLFMLMFSMTAGAGPVKVDEPEKILRAHGVRITEQSVVGSLLSTHPEVRKAAADVIVKRWPNAAVSAIEPALQKETDGLTRISMATDLARLGDHIGSQFLVKECHNTAEWGSIRMVAAAILTQEFGNYSCVDSIRNVLNSDSDPRDTAAKETALELVPDFIHHLGSEDYKAVVDLVIKALADPWPGVRSTASRTLNQIGDIGVIPALEAAVANEKDENGRQEMNKNLKALQRRKQAN